MEDIIKAVMQQTGLSNEIAKQAVAVVLSQLKTQLPKPFADQLDALLGGTGASGSEDVMGTVMKGLGGMFGGGKIRRAAGNRLPQSRRVTP